MNNNKNNIRVIVATPSYDGRYDVRYLTSFYHTMIECAKNNITILPYFLCYDSLIQRARNDCFKLAYDSKVDALFFIDSDIGWNAEDFIKLVLSDKDMIGGTYRKKTEDEELYAFKVLDNNSNEVDFNLKPDDNGILEVYGMGCGFLKLSKKCIKELWEKEQNFYYEQKNKNGEKNIIKNVCECVINEDNYFVSEDIIIGAKWRSLGYKLYLDTNINCVHVGHKEYHGEVKKWLENWSIKLENLKSEAIDEKLKKYFNNSENDVNNNNYDDDAFKVL
jgi:hypothetical protein